MRGRSLIILHEVVLTGTRRSESLDKSKVAESLERKSSGDVRLKFLIPGRGTSPGRLSSTVAFHSASLLTLASRTEPKTIYAETNVSGRCGAADGWPLNHFGLGHTLVIVSVSPHASNQTLLGESFNQGYLF